MGDYFSHQTGGCASVPRDLGALVTGKQPALPNHMRGRLPLLALNWLEHPEVEEEQGGEAFRRLWEVAHPWGRVSGISYGYILHIRLVGQNHWNVLECFSWLFSLCLRSHGGHCFVTCHKPVFISVSTALHLWWGLLYVSWWLSPDSARIFVSFLGF